MSDNDPVAQELTKRIAGDDVAMEHAMRDTPAAQLRRLNEQRVKGITDPKPPPKPTITPGPKLSHSFTARTIKVGKADRTVLIEIEGHPPTTVKIPRVAGHSEILAHKAAFAAAKKMLGL